MSWPDERAWVDEFDLVPHPEGGWYRQTWRSDVAVPLSSLPGYPPMDDGTASRPGGTAILFLLHPGEESRWHTVRSAELWLYHRGGGVVLETGGTGPHPVPGGAVEVSAANPQGIVAPGHWQRARPVGDQPVLVTCVVVPGFDFADFALER